MVKSNVDSMLKNANHAKRQLHSRIRKPTDGRPAARDVRLPYLPGLDGLRALAVIAVLLYHAELRWIPGGFLGVEVFFVISGYLITALLLAEWRQQGRIDLKAFWLRRARRLLPALYLLLAVTLAFAVVFLPDEVAGLRGDALAAFGYVTNWYFVFDHNSYFEAVGRPSLLQHLWSLAVEEQFYVLWPLLLTAGMMLCRRYVLLTILAGAAASTLLMASLYRPDVDPSRLYYGTDTRAAGLLIGAALAFVWVPGPSISSRARITPLLLDVVGVAALGSLVWFFLRLDAFQPFLYRGGFAAVAISTAVMIAVVIHPATHLSRGLLGWRPLRWIGLRSYGIYLWHWPVFMLTRPQLDVPIDGLPLLALRLVVTIMLADLSYRYVETPIRSGALGEAWRALREARGVRRWWFGVGWAGAIGTGVAFVVVLGMDLAYAQPPARPSYLSVEAIHTEARATPPKSAESQPVPTPTLTPTDASTLVPTLTATSASTLVSSLTPTGAPTPVPTFTAIDAPTPARHVTAIGDSVMISAAKELEHAIGNISIDAAQARQISTVIDILRARRATGQLGEVVLVHVGNNGPISASQFDEMMQVLADVPRVVVMNVKVPRFWEGPNNVVLAEGVQRYPNSVLVDWHTASVNRPELFWDDGIHLRPEGALVYADLAAAHLTAP
jgi:peptidoglycan/LPS O-acetylase OafA/YrhL